MKVIERGSPVKKITCSTCKSKLEYEPSDLVKNGADFETSGVNYYIVCPVCNEKITVQPFPSMLSETKE